MRKPAITTPDPITAYAPVVAEALAEERVIRANEHAASAAAHGPEAGSCRAREARKLRCATTERVEVRATDVERVLPLASATWRLERADAANAASRNATLATTKRAEWASCVRVVRASRRADAVVVHARARRGGS